MAKSIVKIVLGKPYRSFRKLKKNTNLYYKLVINYYKDFKLYSKHSMLFKLNSFEKIESRIILNYHGIEKGFLHDNFKYRFGIARVKDLIFLLRVNEVVDSYKNSQIASAYLAMCKYYEKHEEERVDISDFFPKDDYLFFKELIELKLEIIEKKSRLKYFEYTGEDFYNFSNSRSSVRTFSGEKIPFETINKVIALAKNAPSVCNRQPVRVYYLDNKETVDNVLNIQMGLAGYTEKIAQLMVVVTDRNYFYSVGERNQLYIDGGIFVMNLLYSLHFYKIAACPAHWGFEYEKDLEIKKEINLKDSEKVICIIPIGVPDEEFKTTLSYRRTNSEILVKVD